jgi:hypothetical protein
MAPQSLSFDSFKLYPTNDFCDTDNDPTTQITPKVYFETIKLFHEIVSAPMGGGGFVPSPDQAGL